MRRYQPVPQDQGAVLRDCVVEREAQVRRYMADRGGQGRMWDWAQTRALIVLQVPHLTRDAPLRSQRTPSSPVPGKEKVSINAD